MTLKFSSIKETLN